MTKDTPETDSQTLIKY